jgi:hypothetical protein
MESSTSASTISIRYYCQMAGCSPRNAELPITHSHSTPVLRVGAIKQHKAARTCADHLTQLRKIAMPDSIPGRATGDRKTIYCKVTSRWSHGGVINVILFLVEDLRNWKINLICTLIGAFVMYGMAPFTQHHINRGESPVHSNPTIVMS